MIRLEQYEEAEELLRGVLREAEVDADAERMSECYEGLALISARRGATDRRWSCSSRRWRWAIRRTRRSGPDLYIEMARLHIGAGDAARAIALMNDCAEQLRSSPAGPGQARALHAPAQPGLLRRGRLRQRRHRAGRRPARRRRGGRPASRARAYYSLSRLYASTGQVGQAIAYADRALAIYELMDDNDALADAHLLYAQNLLDAGETARAEEHLAAPQPAGRPPEPARPRVRGGRGGALRTPEGRHGAGLEQGPRGRGAARKRRPARAAGRRLPGAGPRLRRAGRRERPSGASRPRSTRSASRTAGRASWPRPTAGTASS
jgi:hypothetical protein